MLVAEKILVRNLGKAEYLPTVEAMRQFTASRTAGTPDEIWVTSSSKEVLAIVTLDGKPVGDGKPGPVFRRMYGLYQEFKQRVMRAGKERQAA